LQGLLDLVHSAPLQAHHYPAVLAPFLAYLLSLFLRLLRSIIGEKRIFPFLSNPAMTGI